MPNRADEWLEWMKPGLALLFPPIFGPAARGKQASEQALRSIEKMSAAADEVYELANELRKDESEVMADELARASEEIADAL